MNIVATEHELPAPQPTNPSYLTSSHLRRKDVITPARRSGSSSILLKNADSVTKLSFPNLSFLSYKIETGASLVAQWLRICLLMQGTRVRALIWEDPTCSGAAGPVSHNY